MCVGFVFIVADKLGLGKLPGDIHLSIGRLHVNIPIVTCILLSLILTIVLNLMRR